MEVFFNTPKSFKIRPFQLRNFRLKLSVSPQDLRCCVQVIILQNCCMKQNTISPALATLEKQLENNYGI
jgi:hypothetical protein